MKKGYVDTRWGQLHYRTMGNDGPTILLFHESPLSSVVYKDVIPLMAEVSRVYAFDTPGYGESSGPPREVEIPDYSTTILEGLDNLDLETFSVVGCHTGASIALEIGQQAGPNRIEKVVFSGLPVLTEEERADFLANWAPSVIPDIEGSHYIWAWERYVNIWKEPAEVLNIGATLLLSNLEKYNWAYNAAFRYDPLSAVKSLESPILFITAEFDILIESDRRCVGILPKAKLEIIGDCIGQLPVRVPEQFSEHVLSFILD